LPTDESTTLTHCYWLLSAKRAAPLIVSLPFSVTVTVFADESVLQISTGFNVALVAGRLTTTLFDAAFALTEPLVTVQLAAEQVCPECCSVSTPAGELLTLKSVGPMSLMEIGVGAVPSSSQLDPLQPTKQEFFLRRSILRLLCRRWLSQ